MKKNTFNFILTMVLAFVMAFLLPWWSIMVAAFVSSILLGLKRFYVFLIPFMAICAFWMLCSFYLSNANDFILAKKIALLLPLKGNPYLLILATGIVGGIAAGVAGIFGKQCAILLKNNTQ